MQSNISFYELIRKSAKQALQLFVRANQGIVRFVRLAVRVTAGQRYWLKHGNVKKQNHIFLSNPLTPLLTRQVPQVL